MLTVALYIFMLGLFILGLVFGILFGVVVADRIKSDVNKQIGKRRF
jgi:hypothetical protein